MASPHSQQPTESPDIAYRSTPHRKSHSEVTNPIHKSGRAIKRNLVFLSLHKALQGLHPNYDRTMINYWLAIMVSWLSTPGSIFEVVGRSPDPQVYKINAFYNLFGVTIGIFVKRVTERKFLFYINIIS